MNIKSNSIKGASIHDINMKAQFLNNLVGLHKVHDIVSSWVSLSYILKIWQMGIYIGLCFNDNSCKRKNIYDFIEI